MSKFNVNDSYAIKCNELIRVTILSGDIIINDVSGLPYNTLLYYTSDITVSGNGSIKYNIE